MCEGEVPTDFAWAAGFAPGLSTMTYGSDGAAIAGAAASGSKPSSPSRGSHRFIVRDSGKCGEAALPHRRTGRRPIGGHDGPPHHKRRRSKTADLPSGTGIVS